MQGRLAAGSLPAKHHIAFRQPDGTLFHEECLTRDGFDGPYSLLYHRWEPHRHVAWARSAHGWLPPVRAEGDAERPLLRRHFKSFELPPTTKAPIDARVPLMFNQDVVVHLMKPGASDPVYFSNGDADELFFIHRGRGILRSQFGDLPFGEKDYVGVPRGVKYRFVLEEGVEQVWVGFEVLNDLFLPKQWRNNVGQLRMDAPFCHRDFRTPEFRGVVDEGIRTVTVKRDGRFTDFTMKETPLDVVGWDGSVYPWAFHILSFQPRAGLVHLPPDWHGNFAFKGGLICSFVPRMVDFHPDAIPCPYPHESVHCDEFLFYSEGNFVSRRGIHSGSISFHPMGVMHGPHPGAYEASIGHRTTNELAVMMDTLRPLWIAADAISVEDPDYHATWCP